jgi:hypothetical protein
MISRNLAVALMETIQQHAETFHGGKMDLNRTLSAIGDLASNFLADIREQDDPRTALRGSHQRYHQCHIREGCPGWRHADTAIACGPPGPMGGLARRDAPGGLDDAQV